MARKSLKIAINGLFFESNEMSIQFTDFFFSVHVYLDNGHVLNWIAHEHVVSYEINTIPHSVDSI